MAGAAALRFATPPQASLPAGLPLTGASASPIEIRLVDGQGNPVPTAAIPVTVGLAANPGGGLLRGTVTRLTDAQGVARFDDLVVTADAIAPAGGPSYVLAATAPGLASPSPAAFRVVAGPDRLAFVDQPAASTPAGKSLGSVEVRVVDQAGNPVAAGEGATVVVYLHNNPGGAGVLTGTTTAALDANGLATFKDLAVVKAGAGYTLGAAIVSGTPWRPGESQAFAVTPAEPRSVAYVVPPTDVAAGAPINGGLAAGGVVLEVVDAYGNRTVDARPTVSVAASSGTLGGTTSRTAVAGLVTFNDLTLANAGPGATLRAWTGSGPTATSPAFDVGKTAAGFKFVAPPNGGAPLGNGGFLPSLSVALVAADGSTLTTDDFTRLTIGLRVPAGATSVLGNLTGPLTARLVAGVATFDGLGVWGTALTVNKVTQSDLELWISSPDRPGLPVASAPLTIVAGKPVGFTILEGANQADKLAGQALDPIVIGMVDLDNNLVTATPPIGVSLGMRPAPAGAEKEVDLFEPDGSGGLTQTLLVTRPFDANGRATFDGIVVKTPNPGYIYSIGTLDANLPTLDAPTPFNVTAGDLSALTFDGAPLNSLFGQILNGGGAGSSLIVTLRDAQGNVLSKDSTTTVTLTLDATGANAGGSPLPDVALAGDLTAQAVNGIVTFNRVLVNVTGPGGQPVPIVDGYKLVATAGTVTRASAAFQLAPTGTTSPQSVAFDGAVQVKSVPFPAPIAFTVTLNYGGGPVPPGSLLKVYLARNASNAIVTGPAIYPVGSDGTVTVGFDQNVSVNEPGAYTLIAASVAGGLTASADFTMPAQPPITGAGFVGPISAAASSGGSPIVSVGLGSLTTSYDTVRGLPAYNTGANGQPIAYPPSSELFPPSYGAADGVVPALSRPTLATGFVDVPQTNDWWSSLIFRRQKVTGDTDVRSRDSQGNVLWAMHPNPVSAMAASNGLGLSYLNAYRIVQASANNAPNFPNLLDPRYPGATEYHADYGGTAKDHLTPNYGVHVDDRLFEDLVVGLTGLDADAFPVAYSDWTVDLLWADSETPLRATLGRGLPFAYFNAPAGGTATVVIAKKQGPVNGQNGVWRDPTVTAFDATGAPATSGIGALRLNVSYTVEVNPGDGTFVTVTVDRDYGVFLPTGVAWTLAAGPDGSPTLTTDQPLTAANGYFSVAPLPDAQTSTFEAFRSHAYAFVTGGAAGFRFDPSAGVLTTVYSVSTDVKESGPGLSDQPLLALYAHQSQNLAPGTTLTPYALSSPRGPMKLLAGSAFATRLVHAGGDLPMLPDLPDPDGTYYAAHFRDRLYPYLASKSSTPYVPRGTSTALGLENLMPQNDIYGGGQNMYGAVQLVPLLLKSAASPALRPGEQETARQLADRILQLARARLGAWLSAKDDQAIEMLYYEPTSVDDSAGSGRGWNTLLGQPGAFGSSISGNDQHFAWGYWVRTASLIARYDPDWADLDKMGAIVGLLTRQIANPDRSALDPNFPLPYLRFFDAYAGRSLADGAANAVVGNNQESSSEALNFASALFQWGAAVGDPNARDLGAYLYATELNSFFTYYFNQDPSLGTFPDGFSTDANPRPSITNVADGAGTNVTFFGIETTKVGGIQVLPLTGSSYYLAGRLPAGDGQTAAERNAAYIAANVQAMLKGPRQVGTVAITYDVYYTTTYDYQALADPQAALASYLAKLEPDDLAPFGLNRLQLFNLNGVDNHAVNLHWIHVLSTYGAVDTTTTSDAPAYVVFRKGGVPTYVADNPDPFPRTFTFRNPDGSTYSLTVPARTQRARTITASGAPVDADSVAATLDLGGPSSRYFLRAGAAGASGTLASGTPGAGEGALTVGPANTPTASLSFTATGVYGTLDPRGRLGFEIWLDPGFVTAGDTPNVVGSVTIDDGQGHVYTQAFSNSINLRKGQAGYVAYNSAQLISGPGQGTLPASLRNGTVTVTLTMISGSQGVRVRTDADPAQGRVSYLDVPYTIVDGPGRRVVGTVFRSLDRDAIRTPDEPTVVGASVYLDLNRDGAYQSGAEPLARSLDDGSYEFEGVADGTYRVGYLAGAGLRALDDDHDVRLVAGVPTGDLPLDFAVVGRLLAPLPEQAVEQGGTLAVAAATTPAAAGLTLVYALDPGAPVGLTVDPATGLIRWRPAGDLPPGVYTAVLRATVAGDPLDTETTTLTVRVVGLTDRDAYVVSLYRTILGREPDAPGRAFWLGLLDRSVPRPLIVRGFLESREHRENLVAEAYRAYLRREASAAERAAWASRFGPGFDATDLRFAILGSDEYFRLSPNDAAFAAGLWTDLTGLSGPTPVYRGSLSRATVRAALVRSWAWSGPALGAIVDATYRGDLGRPATAADRVFWVAAMQRGRLRPDGFRLQVLASPEAFARARFVV